MKNIAFSPDSFDKSYLCLETAGVIAVAINGSGTITDINRKGCELLGKNKSDLVEQPFFDIFIPEKAGSPVERSIPERCETRLVRENVGVRVFDWQIISLLDKGEEITGYICFGSDVTDLRQVESDLSSYSRRLEDVMRFRISELARINEKLKCEIRSRKFVEERLDLKSAIIEKAAEAILIIDKRGKIIYANEALTHIFKYNRCDVLSLNFRQLFLSSELSKIENVLMSLERDTAAKLHTRQVCRDGTVLSVLINFVNVDTHVGRLILCEITDVAGCAN